jgi:hypothetical protein
MKKLNYYEKLTLMCLPATIEIQSENGSIIVDNGHRITTQLQQLPNNNNSAIKSIKSFSNQLTPQIHPCFITFSLVIGPRAFAKQNFGIFLNSLKFPNCKFKYIGFCTKQNARSSFGFQLVDPVRRPISFNNRTM